MSYELTKEFSVASPQGTVKFNNRSANRGKYHTMIKLSDILTLLNIDEKIECSPEEVMQSPSLFLNADNFINNVRNHNASIMGVEGADTLKKLNYLGAEFCGIFLHFPGYKIQPKETNNLYHWLNSGIKRFESRMNNVKNAMPFPLIAA